jgi:hypothetical protein
MEVKAFLCPECYLKIKIIFLPRKDIFTANDNTEEPHIEEMSVDEIFNGIPGSDYQVWLGGVRKTERDRERILR